MEHSHFGFALLAKVDATIIGYALVGIGFSLEFGGKDAFLDELYVDDNYRNQDIGKGLMNQCYRHCELIGVKAIHLEVDFSNDKGIRLYEREGYYRHDRFLMTKWLMDQS